MYRRALILIVTNNKKVFNKFESEYSVDFIESEDMMQVLIKSRDYIHFGYTLLTHPSSGSLKPNQTPYKSIILYKTEESVDFEKLNLIENSIEIFKKFNKDAQVGNWTEKIKNDFKTVDLSLIEGCLNKYIPMYL